MTRYSVSGTLTPDATTADTGVAAGTISGESYWAWKASGQTWWLQWTGTEWLLCADWNVDGLVNAEDRVAGAYWTNANMLGEYTPANGATGTATVAEYVPPPENLLVLEWLTGPHAGKYTLLKESL